jgi:hypothetical protein
MKDLADLIDRHFTGGLTPDERIRLAELLRGEAQARAALMARARLEAALHRVCAQRPAARPSPPGPSRRARWAWVAAAAAAIAIASAWWCWTRPAANPEPTVLSGALSSVDGRAVTAIAGAPVVVAGSAPAVVAMPDGSQAQLAPATQVVFRHRSQKHRWTVDLLHGRGRFTVARARGAAGRIPALVVTPVGRVLVLGTQFTIECPRRLGARTMEVAVQEGRVQVEVGGEPVALAAGERHLFTEPEVRPPSPREGVLVAIEDQRVTLRPGREEGPLATHPLAAGAQITVDGRAGEARSIPLGTVVRYLLDGEQRIIDLIAAGMQLSARVEWIDAARSAVGLSSAGMRQAVEMRIDDDAAITLDGATCALVAVPAGSQGRIQLSVDGERAIALNLQRPSPRP